MALPVQWTLGVLKSLLPEPVLALLEEHILDPASPFQQLLRQVSAVLTPVAAQMYAVIAPLLDRATQAIAGSPDAVILIFLLAFIVFVVQLLAYLQRIMLFWTRLAFRMLFWSVILALGAVMWQRGLEQSARDAAVLGRQALGFGTMLQEVFMREYRKYDDMEKERRMASAGRRRF
ncbi:hypothetical protein B0T16DRAFT_398709 [Cercophora newfieldiana]|uniref:Uncharacterized protein n=1 Tax=Cercophora newfieldiana TaxID=92897 RepID=A0AA40D0U8_9PEZI|nr:hypothetical protein B0T16DRAFT_398709 [Cercophora newfieldiana]